MVLPSAMLLAVTLEKTLRAEINTGEVVFLEMKDVKDMGASQRAKYKEHLVLVDEIHLMLDWFIENEAFGKKIIGLTATMEDQHRLLLKKVEDNHMLIDASAMGAFEGTKVVHGIQIAKNLSVEKIIAQVGLWLKDQDQAEDLPSLVFFDSISTCE